MISIRKSLFSLASAGVLMLLATVTQAATRYVPSQYSTIQAAINAAATGDTIVVAAGTYRESLTWQNKDLTIQGAGEGVSIIDPSAANGGPGGPCLYAQNLTTASRIDRFTLQNGNGAAAGMYNDRSSPTVTNCTFLQTSETNEGSGMFNFQSDPTVTNCSFSGNRAFQGAGMLNIYPSQPTVTNCYFAQNTASNSGGGMVNTTGSSPSITNCIFVQNRAANGGGMENGVNSSPTITNCNFIENEAVEGGGGMSNIDSAPTVTGCTFRGNTLLSGNRSGGGMRNHHSQATVTNCTFTQNVATNGSGGGMTNNYYSHSTVTNCTFTQNRAIYGGGMYNFDYSSPTVTHCTFRENFATLYGGGMHSIFAPSLSVTHCTFLQNTAAYGGGMSNDQSSSEVTNCLFTQNAGSHGGGGMFNSGDYHTLTNCTFTLNRTSNIGGGLCNTSNPSTIVTLTNCILWGNTSDFAYPGIYGDAILKHSNVQGLPNATPNANGSFATDPLFVDAPNGDLHLLSNSPCINRGSAAAPNLPAADLEGNPRIVDIAPDLGAYEFQTITSVTLSGTVTLEDCVNPIQTITFEFRPADDSGSFTRTATLSATGAFSLPGLPRKNYTVWIKGAKWLAAAVSVNTSNGNVHNLTATLWAGDANNDNSVDVLDLDTLIQAFDSGPGYPNWNTGADFNSDDSVDVLDLDILIRNFDQAGSN